MHTNQLMRIVTIIILQKVQDKIQGLGEMIAMKERNKVCIN